MRPAVRTKLFTVLSFTFSIKERIYHKAFPVKFSSLSPARNFVFYHATIPYPSLLHSASDNAAAGEKELWFRKRTSNLRTKKMKHKPRSIKPSCKLLAFSGKCRVVALRWRESYKITCNILFKVRVAHGTIARYF